VGKLWGRNKEKRWRHYNPYTKIKGGEKKEDPFSRNFGGEEKSSTQFRGPSPARGKKRANWFFASLVQ